MSPVVAERCGGNPFYITAVVQQAAEQEKPIANEEMLNELLAVDISSGLERQAPKVCPPMITQP